MSVCVPSTMALSTAVTVIVCGVFQFEFVNVRVELERVTWLVRRDAETSTSFVGWVSNTAV